MENRLARIKHLRHLTGIGLRAAIDIVDADKDAEMIAEWGDKEPASLPNLTMMMAPLMPGHPARVEYDSLIAQGVRLSHKHDALQEEVGHLRGLLIELHTRIGQDLGL